MTTRDFIELKPTSDDPQEYAVLLSQHILKRQNKKFYNFAAHNAAILCLRQLEDLGYVTLKVARNIIQYSGRPEILNKYIPEGVKPV